MKTNKTMVLALLGAATCSFFFGLGQHTTPADPVLNCIQSCCEPEYCWSTNATLSAQVTGKTYPFAPGDNSNQAIVNIWVPVQTPGGCSLVPAGKYDQWSWPNNTPTCEDSGGNFPQPQGVTPGGKPTLSAAGSGRNVCGNPVP